MEAVRCSEMWDAESRHLWRDEKSGGDVWCGDTQVAGVTAPSGPFDVVAKRRTCHVELGPRDESRLTPSAAPDSADAIGGKRWRRDVRS
jgi:hypothetical protein